MWSMILIFFVALVAVTSSTPTGAHAGAVVSGPSGIVTSHGPIGPAALGLGGLGYGGYGGHGAGRVLGGFAGFGGFGHGLGLAPGLAVTNGGGTVGIGHHGVTIKGPATVPATIAGPAGKVVADGLYGVPSHGHGW
ncbi:hypothetical protein NQ318_014493 [Aromia moschata]|uniref:Uncharacterized protein n=1 Tax=Aromia moschata TaxID=1265417 RepID=A0AAV8YPD1_9CUCU|nr:hypothetical protein NQ318_014493 [Aromia moschata]